MATYNLTQTIPTNIEVGDILNCPYSGTYKSITLPAGTYKLECWGAQGGSGSSTTVESGVNQDGGTGGYSIGTLSISINTLVFLYVGGKGSSSSSSTYHSLKSGGFNGGGDCPSDTNSQTYSCGGGGGASDIRIGSNSLYARVIVAGGGGGGTAYDGSAGVGGGTTATAGIGASSSAASAAGGTQSSGGSCTGSYSGTSGGTGGFGTGGTGGSASGKTSGAGGGGGWYGGAGGFCGNNAYAKAGGGGSGYVYTSSTASNYPSGCLLDSSMYLTDANTIAGNVSMPSTSGSTETGHVDNGYVRITVLSIGNNTQYDTVKIKTGDILNYTYSGTYATITLPKGIYQLECWGAQGGYNTNADAGGKGGYSVGNLTLDTASTFYIYVGGKGTAITTSGNTASGGFNGGGSANASTWGRASGGGASDIRIGSTSLYARVIVAGGGGGSVGLSSNMATEYTTTIGYGGGTSGGSGGAVNGTSQGLGTGGSQTSGGTNSTSTGVGGSFGIGGGSTSITLSGGGGGWYGGAGGSAPGGGSGYVYTSSTASNYPSGCLLDSSMYLTDASTIAGNTSFPSTSGSTETGHSGNGYVRITAIYVNNLPFRVKQNNEWKETIGGYVKVSNEWKEISKVFHKVNNQWIDTISGEIIASGGGSPGNAPGGSGIDD